MNNDYSALPLSLSLSNSLSSLTMIDFVITHTHTRTNWFFAIVKTKTDSSEGDRNYGSWKKHIFVTKQQQKKNSQYAKCNLLFLPKKETIKKANKQHSCMRMCVPNRFGIVILYLTRK